MAIIQGRLRLADGNEKDVAIKRVTNQDAAKELMGELETLAKLRHKNVLRLVGFCIKGKKLFVCNEMLSNGSLDTHLHVGTGQAPLSWSTRYEIVRGVCDGLHYLHGACNNTVWHMDIKPDNILLDDQMKPKIADFGLSRSIRGYMAPEFVKDGRVGCECDIYSLGILIMVIVMGKGPDGTELCGTAYINEIRQKFDASNPQQLMKYACLGVCDNLEAVKKCLVLAFDCVQDKPEARPTTKEICARLNITASDTTEVQAELN
ncbi:cysteine-rich receptor-like protein kinase 14 [Miscanthus floridulus]|uniref:cysteine-rich receptor-like protein kinase 14 n=1 Tax=Miscanthus floridulus TaxID=154761 RepID=UPI003457C00B